MFTVDFFYDLGVIGWFGLVLWFVLPILLVATASDEYKNFWFKDFDSRIPNMQVFTNIFSEWGGAGELTWLILRLIIMQGVMMGLGLILMQF